MSQTPNSSGNLEDQVNSFVRSTLEEYSNVGKGMPTIPFSKPTATRSHSKAWGQLSRVVASATPGTNSIELCRSSG